MKMWISAVAFILIATPFCIQQDLDVQDDELKYPKSVIRNKKSRITNGTMALMGFFPFIGSLIFYGGHKCGVSIISMEWVLSAAHCCYYANRIVPDNAMEISVGNVYWHDGERHRVERKFVHKGYDADRIINDIAVMKVRVPFTFGISVGPMKLLEQPIMDDVNDIPAVVLGWGQFMSNTSKLSKVGSDLLQYVNVTIVNIKNCQKHYSDITSKNICVFTGDRKGTCNGDSGGPLVMKHTDHYMQVGVVSYGASCNNTVPEVYTRVSAYYSWIKSNIKKKRSQTTFDDDSGSDISTNTQPPLQTTNLSIV